MEILKNFKFYIILGILLIFTTTIMSNLGDALSVSSWSSLKAYKVAKLYGIKLYFWHSIGLMIFGYAYYIIPKK